MRFGPSSDLMRRMPAMMSGPRPSTGPHARLSGRWVATYFVAALRPSAIALRGNDRIAASGGPIGRGPVGVGEIAVIGGVLDHAVQRDVFDNLELSHLRSAGTGKRSWSHACHTGVSRATVAAA